MLPLTASRSLHSRCGQCNIHIAPSQVCVNAPVDVAELLGMPRSAAQASGDSLKITIGTTAGKDSRVQEEAFCSQCNKFQLCFTYARQTRGADEGQTIFYECKVCKSEWSLNS